MKPSMVVADTSSLIALAVMDLLPLLSTLFNQVLVPSAVVTECLNNLSNPKATTINAALADNILAEQAVADKAYCAPLARSLPVKIFTVLAAFMF